MPTLAAARPSRSSNSIELVPDVNVAVVLRVDHGFALLVGAATRVVSR